MKLVLTMNLEDLAERMDVKKLMFIPIAMMIISMVIVGYSYTNSSIPLGTDLKGGTLVVAYGESDIETITSSFENNIGVRPHVTRISDPFGGSGFKIEMDEVITGDQKGDLRTNLENLGFDGDLIQIQSVGPSFSQKSIKESIQALLFAFIFMAFVVFIRFKTAAPSLAVILSAFSDIVITLAVMIIFGIEVSLGTVVALLLIIGYSVDTDILLTSRILTKKRERFNTNMAGAMKTGLTMTTTTLVALFILYVGTSSLILKSMALVITIGLIVDLLNTWLQNTGILKWYMERAGYA